MSGTSRIPIDDAIRACFPAGHRVITAYPYGTSSWSRTARVVVRLPDSSVTDYFLRCMTASDDVKIQGEFISMQVLCDASPDVVPRPYAWVTTNKFGYGAPRIRDGVLLDSGWFNSWADCFGRLVTTFFAHEIDVNGKWPAYETAFKDLISKTIPRLLGRLQSEGRHIRPSLVHGNLSSDNVGVRQTDGMPVLFGACAIYAHHEYELGASRLAVSGFDKTYVDQYLRTVLPSEPIDEVHHRIILYGIRFNLAYSISRSAVVRESIYDDMRYLNSIYAELG